jgi:hypothetical protein
MTMFTTTKIALSIAVMLGTVSAALATEHSKHMRQRNAATATFATAPYYAYAYRPQAVRPFTPEEKRAFDYQNYDD